MKRNVFSRLICVLRDEKAQVLPMMAVLMIGFLGMAAIVLDVGDVYYSYHELQASSNAAALAAAEALPTSGTLALQNAKAYSSQSSEKNSFGNLNVIGYTATLGCVKSAVGASVPCMSTDTGASANAIQVKQTARVPLYFAAFFGHRSMDVTASATALASSGGAKPFNIAILVDTTASMATQDTNCVQTQGSGTTKTKYYTRLGCALNGVQGFLAGIYPCAASGCGADTDGVYENSVDKVSLFTFPEPASNTTAANDYNCSGKNPGIVPYTFPTVGASSYSPASGSATYQVTPFMSNFQSTDSYGVADGSLSTSSGSYVSLAVGAKSGCGMADPGGEGTYYAGAIYAAQAALTAEQAAEAANDVTAQNIMIIISDGAATASSRQMVSKDSTTGLTLGNSGVYPSYRNECAQAVTASEAATAAGTTVYTIAYGSPDSGCTTDTLSGGITSPCSTMQRMASSSATFYSDNNQSGSKSSCYSSNEQRDLASIFKNITQQLSHERLIPNSTFPSS